MRVAVLIDADNIPASHAPKIFSHVSKLGTVVIRRLYGRPNSIAAWTSTANEALCEMRPLANLGPAKNGADIMMTVDAMDILHQGAVGAFCIVSDDRDFVPLAVRLRSTGKQVCAICTHADERYRKAFDTVVELSPDLPIVSAFRKVVVGRAPEISLTEAGKLLREHVPIPTTGRAPLRKALEETGQFTFVGSGPNVRVRLTA